MSHRSSSQRRGKGARMAALAVLAIIALGGKAGGAAQAKPLGPCDGPCPPPKPVPAKPKLVTVYRSTYAYSTPYLNAARRLPLRRAVYAATCEAYSSSAGRYGNRWWSRLRGGTWVNNGDLRGKVKMGIGDCAAPGNDGQPRGGRQGCDDCKLQPKLQYVALGDSYASGESLGSYVNDGTRCHRSRRAYPFRLSLANHQLDRTVRACSGVTTADVRQNQVGWLDGNTDLVTVQIGGNDIGFIPLFAGCVAFDCRRALDHARQTAAAILLPPLRATYAKIRAGIRPGTRVVVVGYPHIFPRNPGRESYRCRNFVFPRLRAGEQAAANRLSDRLNEVIGGAARAAGFRYLDTMGLFDGHDACSRRPYLNAYILPSRYDPTKVIGSFHPNAAGHAAEATALSRLLSG